jgi:hypothetical protein
MHGGGSTGPRTAEGLARSRCARWKHGLYSAEALAEQKRVRELLTQSSDLLKQITSRLNDGFTVHGVHPGNYSWPSEAAYKKKCSRPVMSSDVRRTALCPEEVS